MDLMNKLVQQIDGNISEGTLAKPTIRNSPIHQRLETIYIYIYKHVQGRAPDHQV